VILKVYKNLICVLWLVCAVIYSAVGYYINFNHNGGFTYNGEDARLMFFLYLF